MLHLLRTTSRFSPLVRPSSNVNQSSDFKTVYKLPYVRGIGVINRMKLYQTVLTSVAIPVATILNQFGYFSHDDVLFTTVVGLGGIIPLYGLGYFANKLIGIVYLNEKDNVVKFAYLDFWGSRKNVVIPVKEIVPFSESKSSLTDILYFKVRQFNDSKNTFKLCTRYGILDGQKFNKIFTS